MSYPLSSKNFLPGMEFPADVDAALVTFHKKGCPACHKFLPVFDQAALTNPNPDKVLYLTFDLDGATKQMFNGAPFKLTSVPTVMKYEQGKFVEQFENDTGKHKVKVVWDWYVANLKNITFSFESGAMITPKKEMIVANARSRTNFGAIFRKIFFISQN